jgi:hypothetical protein
MVPVPTFKKLRFQFRFRFQLHIKTIKCKFFKQIFGKCFAFILGKLFNKEKMINFNKFIV